MTPLAPDSPIVVPGSRGEPRWISLTVILAPAYFICFLVCAILPAIRTRSAAALLPNFLPTLHQVGPDLQRVLSYGESWLRGDSPYIGMNLYPPLATICFAPLTLITALHAQAVLSVISVLTYASVVGTILWVSRTRSIGVIGAAALSLFSYGFLFELERGQFNIIAIGLCFYAVCLHQRSKATRWVWLAYALFSVSIQLKLYPAIFLLFFVPWKEPRRRKWTIVAALAAFNLLLFTIMGYDALLGFLAALEKQITSPYRWVGNHSLSSFSFLVSLGLPPPIPGIVGLVMTSLCFICLAAASFSYVRHGTRSSTKTAALVLACGALLIPAVSHDYTLPVLTLAYLFYVSDVRTLALDSARCLLPVGIQLGIAVLVFWTFFSYQFKPWFLANDAPVILGIAVLAVIGDRLYGVASAPADSPLALEWGATLRGRTQPPSFLRRCGNAVP